VIGKMPVVTQFVYHKEYQQNGGGQSDG